MRFVIALLSACLLLAANNARASDLFAQPVSYSYAPGDPQKGRALLDDIAGVYKENHTIVYVTGEEAVYEDVLEIVSINDTAAYFKTKLYFNNGHQCFFFGVAEYKDSGAFVYRYKDNSMSDTCHLTFTREQGAISIGDPDGHCARASCGMRGHYNQSFPLSKKRKIRYMPLLLQSEDYKKALAEYEAQKAQ